jgi:methyltransferase OMS1, mitochondrial
MSSTFLRRAGLVVFGGGMYAGSVILSYKYLTSGKKDQVETNEHLASNVGFSFVKNPKRVERFEEIAEFYDDQIGRDESFMGINLLRRSLLYFHAKGTALEVGAGTGRNISYYPSNVERIILADTSDQMLRQAREKLRRMSPDQRKRFVCVVGDASKIDFPDDSFDCVIDTFGLCSFDDPVQVLREMARVCKPDGKILLLEHGRSKSWQSLSEYLDKNAERHAKNWGCIWNRDLDHILQSSPLKLSKVDTWHFGTTYYVICSPCKDEVQSKSLTNCESTSSTKLNIQIKEVDGTTLYHNGEGVRKWNLLGFDFDIYIAKFWSAKPLLSEEEVMACDKPKQMEFTFLKGVSQRAVRAAWKRQMDASVTYRYDDYERDRDQFISMFDAIAEGGTVTVTLRGNETHIVDQGKIKGIIRGSNFQKAFLTMWFGSKAVTCELKQALLGLNI